MQITIERPDGKTDILGPGILGAYGVKTPILPGNNEIAAGGGPTIAVYPTLIGTGAETLRQAGFDTEEITRSLEEVLNRSRKFTVYERSEKL